MLPNVREAHGLPPTGLKIDVQDSMTPPCTATPPQGQGGLRLKAVPYVEFSKPGPQPFDWHEDADAVVVDHSPGIAVYTNCEGNVVVRQHDYPGDSVVIVCPKDARRVAKAITEAAR